MKFAPRVFFRCSRSMLLASAMLVSSLATSALAEDAPGQKVYDRVCARCHGPAGEGAEAPTLVPLNHTADQVLYIARLGRGEMPPLPKNTISNEEIADVVAYLTTLAAH